MQEQTRRERTEATRASAPVRGEEPLHDTLADPLQAHGPMRRSADTKAIAAAGADEPGTSLPHQSRIQQSFGRFDVGGTKAHVGSDAPDRIGADAYATGNDVVFGEQPDLHTAAHEAAHVVQQQGGVQLKGGVGEEGDPYEQHADAVADAVVAGRSAEGLLGGLAPAGGGAPAVQMKGGKKGKQPVKKVEVEVEDDNEEGVESEGEDDSGSDVDPTVAMMSQIDDLAGPGGLTASGLKDLLEEYASLADKLDEEDLEGQHEMWELKKALGGKRVTLEKGIETETQKVKTSLGNKLTALKAAPLYAKLASQTVKTAANNLKTALDLVKPGDKNEAALDAAIDAQAKLDLVSNARSGAAVAWPGDAAGLGVLLGSGGNKVNDGPTTPGRNKVEWTVGGVGFVCESHPYDVGAPDWHKGLHFHVTHGGLGYDHARGTPGGTIEMDLYLGDIS